MDQNKLERLKIIRTEIVNDYLSIVNEQYINDKIKHSASNKISLKSEFISYHGWPEDVKNLYYVPVIDRNDICENKLSDLDIYYDKLPNIDLDKSISQMIEEIIPNNYRLYSLYNTLAEVDSCRQYEISLRRGTICCNDPCCLFLFCKSKFMFQLCCFLGYPREANGCCCYDYQCCCGP